MENKVVAFVTKEVLVSFGTYKTYIVRQWQLDLQTNGVCNFSNRLNIITRSTDREKCQRIKNNVAMRYIPKPKGNDYQGKALGYWKPCHKIEYCFLTNNHEIGINDYLVLRLSECQSQVVKWSSPGLIIFKESNLVKDVVCCRACDCYPTCSL